MLPLLNNIAAQIRPDLGDEVLIFFDGTPIDDKLTAVLRNYPFVTAITSSERVGVSTARNRLGAQAKNEILRFQDADDLLAPYALGTARAIVPRLREWHLLAGGQFIYSDRLFNRTLLHPAKTRLSERLLQSNDLLVNMCFFSKTSFLASGGFDPKLEFEEDWDLWLRYISLWGDAAFTLSSQIFGIYNVIHQERAAKNRSTMVDGIPHRHYFFAKHGFEPPKEVDK